MDFLGDLADGADGSLQVNMTIEAFLLLVAMIGYVVIQGWKFWRNGKGVKKEECKGHADCQEKLLRSNGKILEKIEGHLSTQAGTMEHLVTEQRNTTDAISDLEKEVAVGNAKIATFIQAGSGA